MAKTHGVETPPPDALNAEQRTALAKRLEKNLPQFYPRTWPKDSRERARTLVAECLAWHEGNGRWRVDWVATCFQWISKHHRDADDRRREYRQHEYPREQRAPGDGYQGELVRLADYMGGKR